MLKDIIPAEWRKPFYAVYSIIGVILGSIQIAYNPDPEWLTTSVAIYLFVGGAFGAVASSNTVVEKKEETDPEPVVESEDYEA